MAGLERFVEAQAPAIDRAMEELRRGRKASHWMWFVFPQLKGLGRSPTARFYAIDGLDEASAYARHPVLGARLRQCTEIINSLPGDDPNAVFGSPDDLKLRSSMTLFSQAADDPTPYAAALAKYFAGQSDQATLDLLD